ncbi:MAG: hypothetical protein R3B53_00020 [Candidatus Paceibacterota bacterium]
MSRPFIFLLLWLILPTDFARAIPPPDLIISSTQAVFATLGLLASSLFISWSQVKTWLLINNKNKFIFILSIILILFSLYVLAVKFQKHSKLLGKKL